MKLNPEVNRQIEEIRQDRMHGASWLARQAILVLIRAVEESEAKQTAYFQDELTTVARKLIEARPSMAPITNCVSRFIYTISQKSEPEEDLSSLKSFACSKANQLVKDSEEALTKTTEKGTEIIENGDRLMTCSYSSTVCQAFRIARVQGKEFHVIVAESRFGSKIYGELVAEQLKAYGVQAEIIHDNDIGHFISKVRKVLVGADSISADGSLINGIPTYAIAMAAKRSQVPLYSLCETTKFDIRSYFGQPIELEEGFDRVPPHLISGIITEAGIISPDETINYIKNTEWIQSVAYISSDNPLS